MKFDKNVENSKGFLKSQKKSKSNFEIKFQFSNNSQFNMFIFVYLCLLLSNVFLNIFYDFPNLFFKKFPIIDKISEVSKI